MKKILRFLSAGVLVSVLCAVSISCNNSGRNTYVTEKYYIVNQLEVDVVVEFKSGEVLTIRPDEQLKVQEFEMVYEPGIAYSRSMYTVNGATMKIDGEVVPEYIWLYKYWDSIRKDGSNDYHYSITYTLTVTDELLETVKNSTEPYINPYTSN